MVKQNLSAKGVPPPPLVQGAAQCKKKIKKTAVRSGVRLGQGGPLGKGGGNKVLTVIADGFFKCLK
jgi:hypothetical protein